MNVVKDTGERAPLPPFTDEHLELRESVGRFVAKEIAPNVEAWEDAREFPRELFARCGELGFLGLKFPEEYGGQGGTHLHEAAWIEELSRSGARAESPPASTPTRRSRCRPVFKFGTEEQRQRWIVPGIRGELVGALGITEPGAGSNVADIRTTARRVEGGYVVNGSKTFITNGVRADFLVCAVKTDEEGGHHGLSFLVLERDMPGYEVTSKLEKMGWHASDIAPKPRAVVFRVRRCRATSPCHRSARTAKPGMARRVFARLASPATRAAAVKAPSAWTGAASPLPQHAPTGNPGTGRPANARWGSRVVRFVVLMGQCARRAPASRIPAASPSSSPAYSPPIAARTIARIRFAGRSLTEAVVSLARRVSLWPMASRVRWPKSPKATSFWVMMAA